MSSTTSVRQASGAPQEAELRALKLASFERPDGLA